MKPTITLKMRVSVDSIQNQRFSKNEIIQAFNSDNVSIQKNLVIRKSDGAVMGEIMRDDIKEHLEFAEWLDIKCYRDGEHEWKYNGDNYTKKYTTTEMYLEWKHLKNQKS